MDRDTARREIDATLRQRGFRAVQGVVPTYEGPISVHGRKVDVRIEIPDVRFVEQPRICLVDRRQIDIDVLAHVETGASICYASAVGLPLDSYKPGAGILRVLKESETTLERSYRGQGVQEIADEYQQYWKGVAIRSLLARGAIAPVHEASIRYATEGSEQSCVLIDTVELSGWSVEDTNIPSVVFSTSGRIGPVGSAPSPATFQALQDWWLGQSALSAFPWADVETALFAGKACFAFAANACVGFSVSRPADISAGVRRGTIRPTAIAGLMVKRKDQLTVSRWTATDCSIERITSRNTRGAVTLSNRRIALVGCGTIGSHLARMLVQSGAGTDEALLLFDRDFVSPGNLGRHLLNFADLGKNKATALASELERFHPHVTFQPLADNAVERWSMLKECDLIIDATGDWNVQNALNQLFLEDRGERLAGILHSWVFGNGVAAQSFLNLGDEKACFRCLRPAFDEEWRFPAMIGGVQTEVTPASCGDGTFAAFTVDAPISAAALANRAIFDWNSGRAGPRLRTAVLDVANGRYQAPRTPEPSTSCPACAHLRGRS